MTKKAPSAAHPNAVLALQLLEAFREHDEARVAPLVHPLHVDHAPSEDAHGPEGVLASLRWTAETFADVEERVEDIIATDDRVVVRTRFTATQIGEIAGLPPTGRRFATEHLHVWRVEDGLIAEHWMFRDDLATMRQLGAGR